MNNRPKGEWAINKSQQSHAQASKAAGKAPDSTKAHDNNQNERTSTHQVSEGWAGVHYQLYQQDTMKDWILLHNQSTVTIFCNPDLVSDIQEVKGESLDLVTNAGVLRTTQKASIPGWGKAWYNPHAITNIFSYAEMAQKHRITYDSATEDAFIVHLPDKKVKFNKTDLDSYEKLADPKLKGSLCIRSGSHPYNLSLFGAMTEHLGPQKTEAWLKGLVDNMARSPKGGDTDQIKGVASGECGVAVTNTYYLARMMRSTNPADKAVSEKVGVVFPNQNSWGTHVNVAGGAVARHAKNTTNAIQFLEYLASPSAQNHFANGNNEWPAAKGVSFDNPALKAMTGGSFKSELIPISAVGMNQVKVQQMLDRVGFK